jgi:hypothetical protein
MMYGQKTIKLFITMYCGLLGELNNKCTFDPRICVECRLHYLIELELMIIMYCRIKECFMPASALQRRCFVISKLITVLYKNVQDDNANPKK